MQHGAGALWYTADMGTISDATEPGFGGKNTAEKKRWALFIIAAVFVVITWMFFHMRKTDLSAWPVISGDTAEWDVSEYSPAASPEEIPAVRSGLWPLESIPKELSEQYRRFHVRGYDPGFDQMALRYSAMTGIVSEVDSFFSKYAGFDRSYGAFEYAEFIAGLPEIALLRCFEAARGVRGGFSPETGDLWLRSLEQARKAVNGGGILGRAVALNTAILVAGEIRMFAPSEAGFGAAEDELIELAAGLGELVRFDVPQVQAFNDDRTSVMKAVSEIYSQPGGSREPSERRHTLGSVSGLIVAMLGADEDLTVSHVSAVFDVLERNAQDPYSPGSLARDLPGWCRGSSRGPWTRDPVGSALIGAYMKNVGAWSFSDLHYGLEVRSAMAAIALSVYRKRHGVWPAGVDELIADGVVGRDVLSDPFSPSGELLVYSADGDDWTLRSAGPNQKDDGGRFNLAFAASSEEAANADIIYTSGERAARIAASK